MPTHDDGERLPTCFEREEFLNRLRNRDQKAWEEFHANISDGLLNLASRVLDNRSHEEAEDIVQKALLIAFKEIDNFENRSSLKTWMWKIVTNLANSTKRRTGRRRILCKIASFDSVDCSSEMHLANLVEDPRSVEPSQIVMADEIVKAVVDAIQCLSEKRQVCFWLHYFEGRKWKEIAEILGCREATLKKDHTRAKKALKRILEDRGMDFGDRPEDGVGAKPLPTKPRPSPGSQVYGSVEQNLPATSKRAAGA